MLTKWKKISEKILFRNNHWIYKLDNFEIPNRMKGEYHYVHTEGSTLIIPILPSRKLLLVNQYRYLLNSEALEFPCGVLEPNLSPEKNAQKELREETGMEAENLIYAGKFIPYSGVSDEVCYVFIASELKENGLIPDETEEFEIVEFSLSEFEKEIENNIITDGMTLAAWQISRKKILSLLQ